MRLDNTRKNFDIKLLYREPRPSVVLLLNVWIKLWVCVCYVKRKPYNTSGLITILKILFTLTAIVLSNMDTFITCC